MRAPLQLPPGLVRRDTAYDTADRWYDMNLIRFVSGNMQPVGGWNRITASPLDTPVRAFKVWRNNVNARMALAGTDDKLYVDDSGAFTDITPVGFQGPSAVVPSGGFGTGPFGEEEFGTPRSSPSPIFSPYGYWSFANWGEDVIFTANTDGNVYYYTQSTPLVAPTVIADAPTGCNAVIVTDERHVMVIGYDGNPRGIAWSSQEDYTDWDFASTTNTAGFLTLNSRTPLLSAKKCAEGILVFSYTEVFLIRYTGSTYAYGTASQTPLAPIAQVNSLQPSAWAEFDAGKVVMLGRNGFHVYAGGYMQPLVCPFLDAILPSGADDAYAMDPTWGPFRLHASANGRFPEVTFFYPSKGNTECNRYVTWNYVENTWTWGALARSAMHPADAYQYPYMGGTDGHVFEHEVGWLDNGASRVGSVWAETGALSFGNYQGAVEMQQLMIATGSGYGSLSVTAYGRYAPDGPEYTEGPWTPSDTGFTDARSNFWSTRLRFSLAADGPFAVGRMFADVLPSGDMR
jgi:hypothetical protein